MIFGTPEYMAPEQARGLDVDHRTDIYAAGIILFELLSGGVPFVGDSFLEVLNQHVLDPVPPLRRYKPDLVISSELEAVLARMLEKKPDDRFANMKALSTALLATPEGHALRAQLSSSGALGAEFDIATSLMTTETVIDASGRKRSAKTESGHPPPIPDSEARPASTSILGSRDRTPPGRELETPSARQKSSLPLIFGVATVVLAGAAALAWFVVMRPTGASAAREPAGTKKTALAASPLAPADSRPVEPAPAPATVPTPAAAAPAATTSAELPSQSIRLSIVTEPPGAIVHKDGFQVCDATPCELEVSPDTAVTLVARKGAQSGQAKVLAHKDQTVAISLRAPAKKAPAEKKLCEVTVDGLKILRPCE